MSSPTSLSLFCSLLICLALSILIVNTITLTITISAPTATGTGRRFLENPVPISLQVIQTLLSQNPPCPLPQDDDSLLRLASKVSPKVPLRPKKVAFLFLTTTPLHFAPLWELFFNQTSNQYFNIYVHADPDNHYQPPFSGVFSGRVIHSKHTQRHSPTLVSAARRLLAHALLHDPSNAMFALLSASCIPLHSFNFTYKTLITSKKSFVEILNTEEWMRERWAARGEDAMLPDVKLEDFRVGSQFWVMTRKHARLAVSEQKIWAKFNQTCVVRHACYPEENYFPTLIHVEDPRGTVSASLTHVEWTGRSDGHPRMYEAGEVGPELIEAIRRRTPRYGCDGVTGSDLPVTSQQDPFLFARKFSPDSIEQLLKIAEMIISKD